MTANAAFVRALSARVDGGVAADGATLAAYSTDASNHRLVPTCVAFPRSAADVAALVATCRDEGVPITSRGAGTNLAGNAIGSGVVVDYSRHLNRILSVDGDACTAVVEPGVVLDRLQERTAPYGLRFGPDPATHSQCTVGGMIGTNACGARAIAWGTTSANVAALDVVLGDGRMATLGAGRSSSLDSALAAVGNRWSDDIAAELGRFSRQVSGYGLQHLLAGDGFDPARAFVGSEGTCGQVVEATLHLVQLPAARSLVVAGFVDIVAAAAAAPLLAGIGPLTVEGMGADLVEAYDTTPGPRRRRPMLPSGQAWLLIEVGGGTVGHCAELAHQAVRLAAEAGALQTCIVTAADEQQALWSLREQGTGLAARAGGVERWPGWEDAAVPPERLASYLTDFTALLREHGRSGSMYGHFGEGCVHVRIDHDLLTVQGRAAYARFQSAATDLVVAHRGSLSGEHGDGRQRSELLRRMYSPSILDAFAAFKAAFDADNVFNPGLIVDPVPLNRDLRLEIARPHRTGLAFAYPGDDGDFGRVARRCVGVGACRASGGGMCPSYQATADERHSTRGRARVLFEMLDGRLAADGWRSADVLGALDLCLMCKACSSECPASVDMATYKAEFLHHHYRHRLRPRSHLSLGWLPLWLALARLAPRLANAALRSPRLSSAVKRLGGIDQQRQLPQLATAPTFRWSRLRRRWSSLWSRPSRPSTPEGSSRQSTPGPEPVLLWLDTFTRSFAPDVVDDAAAVLRAAGFTVDVAGAGLCCGLTWLSTGQLSLARTVMTKTIAALDSAAYAGPVVVLEPSCAAALRDDAVKLLDSEAAHRVAGRIVSLAELLSDRRLPGLESPAPSGGRVIAAFHCHQRATTGTSADRDLLGRLGVEVTSVDEGCCGLAGNFGFENGHFGVSRTCAEQSFLPYLARDAEATVVADGFSCRLQIQELGGEALGPRRPLHLANLLRRSMAL